MNSLHPEKVISSHFADYNDNPKILDFTIKYLTDYKNAAKYSKTGVELAAKMNALYPTFAGTDILEMSAKVFKGEMDWGLKSPYPAIGNKVEVNFGETLFVLDIKDNLHMSFISQSGAADTVDYSITEIAKNIFMVFWHEPYLGDNVVHIQDYNTGIVYTNIAKPDGQFYVFQHIG